MARSGSPSTPPEGTRARNSLRCGVSEEVPGLFESAGGAGRGLEADFCRAVAAAVLGDPEHALAANFTAWPAVTLPLFVGMMFGGTLGGNATLIGASANLVSAGICAAEGKRITFTGFMRIGVPIALAQLAIGALYVVWILPHLS